MPRKHQAAPIPPNAQTIQFGVEEIKPMFVKATDIDRIVVGLSPKTLANWRSQGVGPKYFLVNGSVYYSYAELEKYFGKHAVETSNNTLIT
ncbi:MAG: hypothetical protein HOK41_07905 [Nitrospina sp.]|jgi:hypothetical protein|nr:hypothetical protein [Nitrospina sp.]